MLESKSLTVSPDSEQEIINTMQNFGWELKSSQEIYSKDSHIEKQGRKNVSVTETTNYVKLVFERDTKMENYERICELENTFFDIISREPERRVIKPPFLFLMILMGYTFISFVTDNYFHAIISGSIMLLVFIILIIRTNKAKNTYYRALAKWKQEEKIAMAALKEAKTLL